ncbi:MAG: xanthine dehydrogenase family protein subunit M [Firmicutes bacterium]|nr:xanthine dehydrogenase family protein subunit M [Bacillota bacterium]
MDGYHIPSTLDEALDLLESYRGRARVIAGGTDLVIQLRKKEREAEALVDLSALDEYKQIKVVDGTLKIGSLCTHSQLAGSSLVKSAAPALAEAAASIGSPQIRNIGTIGGNIVSAQPAADTSIALTALGANLIITSKDGLRDIPLGRVFTGVGKTALDPTSEILTEIHIPLEEGCISSAFKRLSKRKALSLPVLNTAAYVHLSEDQAYLQTVRIAAGPVSTVPWRADEAETSLKGARISLKRIREASDLAAEKASPRNSLRGGAAYRKKMVGIFVYRALKTAIENLGCDLNG